MRQRTRRLSLSLIMMLALPALAGPPADGELPGIAPDALFPGARFDPSIPTQKEWVGLEHGGRPLRHAELLGYLERLAELSPRAEIREYSSTHEGRRMIYMAISEPETIARLDEVREEHAELTDPRGRAASADAARIETAKAVAWMAYGIHGDELSSVDAAAAVAYRLVAGEDAAASKLRRELVILIDPCENPDGRERFLAQTASFAHARPNPDTDDLSHSTVWPWGRGNHYLFDLNRDWFSMVHPESARSGVISGWNPQLMVDSHEMGSHDTYLLSPPRHPFNPHLPEFQDAWSKRFAADQGRALDGRGYSYYTREWNEEFFPGYGSSWASYHGAIGILYEMSGTSGTLVHQRAGTTRTYPQAVEHQVTSSIANLTTVADNRKELLTAFVDARRKAVESAKRGTVAAWFLAEGKHADRVRKLVGKLRTQGIEVLAADAPPKLSGLRDARTGAEVDGSTLEGRLWMVPLDQPAAPLVRVLLDPHVPMQASFLREQREYLERNKGSRLYETTSWSLPLAYGVDAYWSSTRPTSGWSAQELAESTGAVEGDDDALGYAIPGAADRSGALLADLLQREMVVRIAEKAFEVGDHTFVQGTLLVKREENPEGLRATLEEVVARHGVTVTAIGTALARSGPDLGGRHFRQLKSPRVGIWTGSPVSAPSYGALWHLFDEEIDLRFSGLVSSRAAGIDLSRYNVLIFPPARGGSYAALFGESGLAALKAWIDGGGTAIGIGSGAAFLADKERGWTRTRLRREALDRFPSPVWGPSALRVAAEGNFRAVGMRVPDEDEAPPETRSLYDVAPVLGAGALPFAEGVDRGSETSIAPVTLGDWLEPLLAPGTTKPEESDLARADARLRRFATRGTFLRVQLDHEMWMNWGIPDTELPVLTRDSDTLVAEPPVAVPARFAALDDLHLGGLLWPETAARTAQTAYATRESVGRGQVILFLNEPEFRGWTLGTRRLLVNAVLYGPGLGTRWSNPW
ncbi:MAG: hypothetical protein GY716_15640 [bacterium]|nr:hypothetical protein [bacterium]